MTSDVHALSGAYVVGALDDVERIEFEKHLSICSSCMAEVDSLAEAAATLSEITAVAPPERLHAAVMADIAKVRPLAPRVAQLSAGRGRRPRSFLVAAAAAVVVLGAGGALIATHPWQNGQTVVRETLAEQVIHAPDAQLTQRRLADGATVRLYRSASVGRAVVTSANMPLAPAGRTYELWIENGAGVMRPAGLMPRRENAAVVLPASTPRDRGVGITVEPAGGSPQPTSQPIALLPFAQS